MNPVVEMVSRRKITTDGNLLQRTRVDNRGPIESELCQHATARAGSAMNRLLRTSPGDATCCVPPFFHLERTLGIDKALA